jgi:hypothetical protein
MTIVDFVGHLVVTVSLREYGVLVPRHFNDGNPVPPELRRGLEAAMRQAFNGFTALRGLDGSWADDDGREYPDTIDEYRVAAHSRGTVVRLAREIGRQLGQRAVYVRCPSNRVLIVRIDTNEMCA